jgi:hypothetical protein
LKFYSISNFNDYNIGVWSYKTINIQIHKKIRGCESKLP